MGPSQRGRRRPRLSRRARRACWVCCEPLEPRCLLSGSNAIDELDFGNLVSEAAHDFEPGYSPSMMPLTGIGALNQTYREAYGLGDNNIDGPQSLVFTMTVDPARQNYLTVKLWGSDVDGGTMYLLNDPNTTTNTPMDDQGGPPAFPGRFFYETQAIPESWTSGQTSVQLTLDFYSYYDAYGGTGYHYLSAGQLTRPVYSAYITTDPQFVPDPTSPTGTAPAQTTTPLGTITAAQAQSVISAELDSIYGPGGEYSTVLADQIQPGTTGAPAEVIGLDLFTNVASFVSANPGATPDTWRNQIATQEAGTGYTAFPDELLSVLSATYLDTPPSYAPSAELSGYHSSTLMKDIVEAMDGSTYLQGSDGGFATQGDDWIGLTSSPRTSGTYAGEVGRLPTVHGGGDLQGADTYTLGETIVDLLNDPTGGPAFKTYLSETFDADLDGSQMLRAYAYERMLFNQINYFINDEGGTVSQDLFETVGLYADQVALEYLQALYPNSAYPALPANLGLYYAEQAVGVVPTNLLRGHDELSDYAFSADGLGEANGTYSGGYDGGYGGYLSWGAQFIAQLAAEDPGLTSSAEQTGVLDIEQQARNAVNSYDQFIQPGSNVTFNSNGTIATDQQILTPENFITYRNISNPNDLGFNVNTQYLAADPNGPVDDAYALRSVYLDIEYDQTPLTIPPGGEGGNAEGLPYLNYLKSLQNFEDDVNALVGVSPTSMTALPGEPGQPNYAFADVQTGAVAFVYNGEQFYMNANWREPEGETDNLARIDYVTPTMEETALIDMPADGTSVQSDGNLSGDFNSPWVVRFGDYLIVLNHSNVSDTIKLPPGDGNAIDLISGSSFAMGSGVIVAAGQAMILRFSSPEQTNLAGVSLPAAQGSPAAVQTPISIVAGYPAITMANGQTQQFIAEVLNSSGLPINIVPQVTFSLQSGSVGYITSNGIYTAPDTGAGTASVVASYGGLSTSFTVTVVPFIGPGHDVGTDNVTGAENYSSGTYTLTGSGTGISGTTDSFHSLSQTITGDLSVIAQVDSQTGSAANAEAGVMIRDTGTLHTTAANSSFADVVLTSAGTLLFQWRAADGGTVSSVSVSSPSSTPYVEITRSGNSFSAFDSTNGTTWTQIGSTQTVTMSQTCQGAVICTGGTASPASTATFTNVQIVRPASEFPTISSVSVAWRGGTSTTINTIVSAADGSAGTALTYTWIPTNWASNGETNVGGPGANVDNTNYNVTQPGTYTFAIEVTDAYGLTVFGSGTTTVSSGVVSLSLTNPTELIAPGATQQMTLNAIDQFGLVTTTPGGVVWSVSGGGKISSSGLYTAPETAADATVTATVSGLSASTIAATAPLTTAGIDIGDVGVQGGEIYENGIYTVTGAGAGMAGSSDDLHFVSNPFTGNFTATTELNSQTAGAANAGAGLMIRNTTAANSIFAAITESPVGGDGLLFQWRSSAGGPVSYAAVPVPLGPVWLQLVNSSGTVSAYYSTNGSAWTPIGSGQSLSLGTTPQVGLTVYSGGISAASTAVFANTSVIPTTGPSIATPATASAIVTGKTDSLSALGSDSHSAVTYTWAAVNDSPAGATFSPNGTTAAANSTATFTQAGTYDLRVTMSDSSGFSVTSDVIVDVEQTLKSVAVTPGSTTLATNGTQQFIATADDQFGNAMATQPYFAWVSNAGIIGVYTGLFTAPSSTATVTVTATTSGISGNTSVRVASLGIFTNAQDVGAPTPTGATNYSNGTFTLTGSGIDIYSEADQFQYAYETLTGNGTITAFVASEQNTNSFAKAGVMIRNGLNTGDINAMVNVTPSQGTYFSYRTSTNGGTSRSNVSGIAAPYWVQLTRTGNVFTAFISTNGTTWTQLGSAETISMNPKVYIGLIDCSHDSGVLGTAVFTNVSVTEPTLSFAANEDIGSPSPAGSYSQTNGTVTLTGGGTDIAGTSDQFQYGYNILTGTATLTAEVTSLTNTNSAAKAGLMFRNTLTASSADASIFVTPGSGIIFQWRTSIGAAASQTTVSGLKAPYWLRLSESGDVFTAFYSSNGSSWTQIGAGETVSMNSDFFGGLTVTSRDSGTATTATFTNISQSDTIATYPQPTIAAAAVAAPNPVTSTTSALSVLGGDLFGEGSLIYSWQFLAGPSADVTFSINGTNAAKDATATFPMAGAYLLEVVISDPNGYSTASLLPVNVNPTLTSIAVTPALPEVGPNGTDQFTATALDQFGNAMTNQPAFSWSLASGGGSVSNSGLYTAPLIGGAISVSANSGNVSGTGSLAFVNQPPLIANSVGAIATPGVVTIGSVALSVPAVDDGGASNLSYTWSATTFPAGAMAPTFSANAASTTAALYAPGTYVFTVTVTDSGGLTTTSSVSVTFNLAADTWTGSQSNDWNDPSNWSADATPGTATTVTINSGAVALSSPITIAGFTLNGGTLDLGNNAMFIDYGASDPISAITSYLADGYNGGAWNGSGIFSSAVASENAGQSVLIYSVGYADGADGITGLPSGVIEVMPTLAGDAKLQGNVVFGDFQLLSQYFGQAGSWDEGNFTYGSTVNFGDFQLLSQNFGQSAALHAGADEAQRTVSIAAQNVTIAIVGGTATVATAFSDVSIAFDLLSEVNGCALEGILALGRLQIVGG
jgi:regulation of enolase protein 1 (concanavalin A-like superfamily)